MLAFLRRCGSCLPFSSEGEQMKRKFRIANAKQSRSADVKRAAVHQAQAAAIQRRQKRYNNEVAMAQCEVSTRLSIPYYFLFLFLFLFLFFYC